MTFCDPRPHSESLFKSMNIVELNDLIKYHILKFVFRWKKKLLPACFSNLYNFLGERHTYQIRQALSENIYLTKKYSDQFGLRSIQFTGATLWNQIPYEIKISNSLSVFNRKLKQYMIDGYASHQL